MHRLKGKIKHNFLILKLQNFFGPLGILSFIDLSSLGLILGSEKAMRKFLIVLKKKAVKFRRETF